jgi:hypothetical protein
MDVGDKDGWRVQLNNRVQFVSGAENLPGANSDFGSYGGALIER